MQIEHLLQAVDVFRSARSWNRFHSPKELSTALSIEVAELQELFLWKNHREVDEAIEQAEYSRQVTEEVGDILIYALMLCSELDISPTAAILGKLRLNDEKYPVSAFSDRKVRKEESPSTE